MYCKNIYSIHTRHISLTPLIFPLIYLTHTPDFPFNNSLLFEVHKLYLLHDEEDVAGQGSRGGREDRETLSLHVHASSVKTENML